ncbi:AP2/ERF and B3 domain-containing transcription factor RAV1-like protein [Drosera capensis]
MEELCNIIDQHENTFCIMDQWSSIPPLVSLGFSDSPAGGGLTTNNKLHRMDCGTSVILDPPENTNSPEGPRKAPCSKYKGVVPQPNGRWGAQIYIKNKRIWLGTFDDEKIEARAYDISAHRFRGWDTDTNFKPIFSKQTSDHNSEIEFLRSHTEAEIVDTVRKKSYYDELHRNGSNNHLSDNNVGCNPKNQVVLFDKVVTYSDVGKLNRLVIPKHQALRHFPSFDGPRKCMPLNFLDVDDKVWSFRYSYWKSSGSYVLSKGWICFVREKNLKAGDVISFERSTGPDKQIYINLRKLVKEHSSGGHESHDKHQGTTLRLFGVDITDI